MVVFNANKLKVFKVRQLRMLADYYAVKYNKRTTKTELIDKIMLILNPQTEEEDQDVQMSVRIKRIKDSIGE